MTILIISNENIDEVMKIVKSLEESGSLIKCVCETIKNEAKEQRGGFLGQLKTQLELIKIFIVASSLS